MNAKRYHEKPEVIGAMKYDGTNGKAIVEWASEVAIIEGKGFCFDNLFVLMPEGMMIVDVGDWIIRGFDEFYLCKLDIFEVTYKEVTE